MRESIKADDNVYFFRWYGKSWGSKKIENFDGMGFKGFEVSFNLNKYHNYFTDASISTCRAFVINMEKYEGDFKEIVRKYKVPIETLIQVRREVRLKKLMKND
ncbi:MAG: hypothetical protein SLAVMIC_00232 [uncultured marine phage]|uniref:Uncharacterized protein n=1 Tax=uncultured marine phage TaxID=707152 RepID=A0A8D9CCP8_9VIRU|nr:MAG: hypothetical protein SLAVMIC_00232 [uncultured marine phage]